MQHAAAIIIAYRSDSQEVDLEDYVSRPEKISCADIAAICQEAGTSNSETGMGSGWVSLTEPQHPCNSAQPGSLVTDELQGLSRLCHCSIQRSLYITYCIQF